MTEKEILKRKIQLKNQALESIKVEYKGFTLAELKDFLEAQK